MIIMKKFLIGSTAAVGVLCALAIAFPTGVPQGGGFTPPPELDAWNKPRQVAWVRTWQDASVEYEMDEKLINVHWAGLYDEVDQFQDIGSMVYPLSYQPTDVDMLGDDIMLIAGVDSYGKTIIERYKFRWPTVASHPFAMHPSGAVRYILEYPAHTGTKRCYEGDVPGKKLVRFLLGLMGTESGKAKHALVQFHDSSDVYTVNTGTDMMTQLASSTVTAGTLGHVPSLGDGHDFSWKADHDDYGYIYVFGFEDNVDSSDPPTLVFVDDNRDGLIDSYLTVPAGSWIGTEWDDPAKYTGD